MEVKLGSALLLVPACCALGLAGCTPDVGHDAPPEALEFDSQAVPPRVPQPTGLIINPLSGHIDFALAGTPLPADCAESEALSPAECAFDRYLESLDGYPSLTPATAPASAELDASTLTLGENVVVLSSREPGVVSDLELGFDAAGKQLVLRPKPSWALAEYYWLAVRGYAGGVRASDGSPVVGSPTIALLKQAEPLTCGAPTPEALDTSCPALRLLAQTQALDAAKQALFTLEAIRKSYEAAGVWQRMAAAGLPKEEIAVLWGFPIHSSSVAEIEPAAGLVPQLVAADELRVAVHGPVEASTVSAFVLRERLGSVLLMDLTAAEAGDLVAGFPKISASYSQGEIVIHGERDFVKDHQYGVFLTRAITDPSGAPLAPAPISALLTSRFSLLDDAGNSAISSVADADAALLEVGRSSLAALFDNPVFGPLTGVAREDLVYCFAFQPGAQP